MFKKGIFVFTLSIFSYSLKTKSFFVWTELITSLLVSVFCLKIFRYLRYAFLLDKLCDTSFSKLELLSYF